MMLTQICQYLKNWFVRKPSDILLGEFTIEGGQLSVADHIETNRYYRIVGSVFNDGVYKHDGKEKLTDETFEGGVWLMAVPKDVIDLAAEITAWQAQYGGVDSENMSPFQSESFGGYSYTKKSGGSGSADGSAPSWQSIFADRLRRYKKL